MDDLSYSAQHSGWEDYPAAQWDERKPISWLDDWEFWHYCIEKYSSTDAPILELACGNGRITRQIVLSGYTVFAVDINPHFLNRAQANIPSHLTHCAHFFLQDVVYLSLNRQFSVAIMADWAFPSILTPADQLQFLRSLSKHLLHEGIFAFNTLFPTIQQIGLMPTDTGFMWPDGRRFDPMTQIETRLSGDIPLQFRHTTLSEIEWLCQMTGFAIRERYGNVDRRPLRGIMGDDLTLILQKVM